MITPDELNRRGVGKLPGHLGVHILAVADRELRSELAVAQHLMAPNGFLHAGAVVTLADPPAATAAWPTCPPAPAASPRWS